MRLQDIKKLIGIQDDNITNLSIEIEKTTVNIFLDVLNPIQDCPCCHDRSDIIPKGKRKKKHIPVLQKQVVKQARETENLVIGIDDFANRKSDTYNTGFHDLKNGTLLLVTFGRTYSQLSRTKAVVKLTKLLNPIAVVMDLAKSYHKFAEEYFPNALRIADRFHVNRYITDALQSVRKRVCCSLKPVIVRLLKRYKNLLGKRHDSLNEKKLHRLFQLLNLSEELTQAYLLKEELIEWYDCNSAENSYKRLLKWIERTEELNIPEINTGLTPFKNWTIEISNYHQIRYTNAQVEGRNNKIKKLQRRCYFLRNRTIYKQRIYLECNAEKL